MNLSRIWYLDAVIDALVINTIYTFLISIRYKQHRCQLKYRKANREYLQSSLK